MYHHTSNFQTVHSMPKLWMSDWVENSQRWRTPHGMAVSKLWHFQMGMRMVLEERGIYTSGWTAERMRQELRTFDDFQNVKTISEEDIESRGHICVFLPKFHCELNPIERVWCHAQWVSDTIMKIGIWSISYSGWTTNLQFVTVSENMKEHAVMAIMPSLLSALKKYKSHRRVHH